MTRELRRRLTDTLSESEADALCSSFDQIGQIAIIRIPESLYSKKKEIGAAVLEQASGAKRVFCQTGDVTGSHRTRDLELIAGSGDTRTEYREHGCVFLVDVARVFFSPRLSTERARIASLVSDGQNVLNMFGGVGAFSIIAAKSVKCTVYNIDINDVASEMCEQNIARNKLAGTVISKCGDAAKIIADWPDKPNMDRTLMLLPERSPEFLDAAISATKPGGIIHYYSHVHADSKLLAAPNAARQLVELAPRGTGILHSGIVRPVGPRYYQTVVDAQLPS